MTFGILKAFAATFAYLAQHAVLLLKAMWLPALVLAGLQLYAAPALLGAIAELAVLGPNPDPEAAAAAASRLGGSGAYYLLAGVVFFPMLTVASLLHIMRGEEARLPVYFNFGADELRILGANAVFNMMVFVIAVVGDLTVGVLVAVVGLLGAAAASALKSAGELGVNLGAAWFQARLSTLFPASMATRTLGLGAAWDATRGSSLRVVAFWLLIGAVIVPAVIVFTLPLTAQFAGDLAALKPGDNAAIAALLNKIAAAMAPSSPQFWLIAAGFYAMTLLVNAIVNVAAAVAWRYLTMANTSDGDGE